MSRADVMAGRAYVSVYVKQYQLTRGLAQAKASVSRFGSDMMAMGAKVTGFGALMISPITASVKVAANFEEAISKFNFVFKDAKDSTKAWADGFAKDVGRSRLQIVEFLADSQALVMPIGFKDDQAVQMSKQLTALAVDLASFNNMADADVLRDLHAALVGSSETMLKYGVIANEAAVKQELLNMAIKPDEATNQDKVLARYNLILRGTVAAQGDATRTANSLTNMMKALRGIVSDVAVEVGSAVIPAFSRIAKSFVEVIRPMAEMARQNPELVMSFVTVSGAVAAAGVAIMGLGVAAKVTASAMAAASVAYKTAALTASVAWAGVGLAFSVLTIKARISAAIASTAWSVASGVIASSWKILGTVLSASVSTAVLVASATVITGAWLVAAGTISVAIFGLGTVLTTTATVATAAWSAAGGFVTTAWISTAGLIGTAWTAVSGTLAALAGVAMGAWLSGAGIAGTAMAVLGAAFAAAGGTGAVSAAITGAAWSAAGAAASLAWSAFTAVIGTVFTASNLLVFAAFAVKTAWIAAWAVVSGPILPIVAGLALVAATIGSIAAASAYAAVRAADFGASWAAVTTVLTELMAIAKRVGGILMTALGQGDFDIAFKAAIAGVKLALAKTLDGMSVLWSEFWKQAWSMTQTFFRKFVELSVKVLTEFAEAIANPLKGVKISDLKNMAGDLGVSFSFDTKGMADAASAELTKLEKELADRQAKRTAENEAKAKADADKAANEAAGGAGDGTPSGTASQEQQVSEEAAKAFDRETEALQQQIIALRQGAEAAERFRLAKQGLTEDQINQVMALRKEQETITKQQQESERIVSRIQDYADADYEKSRALTDAEQEAKRKGTLTPEQAVAIKNRELTPAQIAAKEKAAIELNRQSGRIDDKTAAEAMAQADIRQAEKEHQERLRKLRGEDGTDATTGGMSFGLKSGGASAATFSAQSLIAMGGGSAQSPQVRALLETKKLIADQLKAQKEQSDAQIAAINKQGLHHT